MGSFFDTSPLGRELSLDLIRHVIAGYKVQEPPLIKLLENAVLHVMPFTEHFDLVSSQYVQNQSVCDPITRDEFADRFLSPEQNKRKTLFLNMLETNRFHLALTFSASGSEIQAPHVQYSNSIYEQSAVKIAFSQFRETHEECALNSLRIHQTNTLQKVTQFLLDSYQLPLYTIQVSCCKMPVQSDIGKIWRRNIHKILNFLKLSETGIKGSIRNEKGVPLRQSTVSIVENNLNVPVSKNLAYFRFVLPAGQYELQINSSETGIRTISINLIDGQTLDLGNIRFEQQKSNEKYQLAVGTAEEKSMVGATISGFILDARNHPIRNAEVSLTNSRKQSTTSSDSSGKFKLVGLPLGTIALKVEAFGYEVATRYELK